MRALFEDNQFAAADSHNVVYQVGLPQNSSRRDLWFRFQEDFGETRVRAYATRSEATTIVAPDSYLASVTFALAEGAMSIFVADNPATSPDMTGLILQGLWNQVPVGNGTVWGYTVTPDLVLADDIRAKLMTYTQAGESLDDFAPSPDTDASSHIVVGLQGVAMQTPFIMIVPQPGRVIESRGSGFFTMIFPVEIQVYVDFLNDPKTAWRMCREYIAAIESILIDEHRGSFSSAFVLMHGGSIGPTQVHGVENFVSATLTVNAEINAMWADDEFPR